MLDEAEWVRVFSSISFLLYLLSLCFLMLLVFSCVVSCYFDIAGGSRMNIPVGPGQGVQNQFNSGYIQQRQNGR